MHACIACVIVAFWRRNYCLIQSFSCIEWWRSQRMKMCRQASIMAQGNSETICVSVETQRTSSAPQQTENKQTLNMNSWALVFMRSCFMVLILGPEHSWYLISKGAQARLLCGLPSKPLSSLQHNSLFHSCFHSYCVPWQRFALGHCHALVRSNTLFPLWKLSAWWNGGVCRRQERSHFKPWGCSCQTSLVYNIGIVLSLPAFSGPESTNFARVIWKSGLWKWQGGC